MSVDHIEAVEYQQLIHSQEVTDAVEVIGQTKQKLERGMWTTGAGAVIVIAMRVFSVYQNFILGAVIITGTALLAYIFAMQVTKKAEIALDRIRGLANQLIRQEGVIKGVMGKERTQPADAPAVYPMRSLPKSQRSLHNKPVRGLNNNAKGLIRA